VSDEHEIEAVYKCIVDREGHATLPQIVAYTGLAKLTVVDNCRTLASRGRIRWQEHSSSREPNGGIDFGVAEIV
jgi:hypothetical protein